MKTEYLIEFLPPELRRQSIVRASRRRNALLVALMTFLAVGVGAHSWNMYRNAEVDRTLSVEVCKNSAKVDDFVIKLASDQQVITRFLGVYDQIASPLETSDLIATITHLMPERMSLAMIKLESEGGIRALAPVRGSEAGAAAGGASKPKKAGGKDAKPVAPEVPKRWMTATIRGYAQTNHELYAFERLLNRTAPLQSVTVTDSKTTAIPGGQLQEFTITCRIPLNARYEASLPTPATAQTTSEDLESEGSAK